MLRQSLDRFPREVEAVEIRIAAFELGDDAERLRIVVEAAIGKHEPVQLFLPRMAERRVAEIVGERQRLGEILVEAECPGERARHLRHLD